MAVGGGVHALSESIYFFFIEREHDSAALIARVT